MFLVVVPRYVVRNKGRGAKMSKRFYDSFNGSMEKGLRLCCKSRRKEGRKEGNSYGVEKEF